MADGTTDLGNTTATQIDPVTGQPILPGAAVGQPIGNLSPDGASQTNGGFGIGLPPPQPLGTSVTPPNPVSTGAGGNGTTTNNSQNVTFSSGSLPTDISNAYTGLLSQAQQVANEPYPLYTGERVAPFNAAQNAAFQGIAGLQGQYNPLLNNANTLAQQGSAAITPSLGSFDANALAKYGNPYTQSVIDNTNQQIQRQAAIGNQGIAGNAAEAGAYGGDRATIAQTENNRNALNAIALNTANLNSQNFSQAQQQFNTEQNRNLAAQEADSTNALRGSALDTANAQVGQNLGLSGLNALLGAGNQQQTQQQLGDTTAYNEFQNEANYPKTQLSWESGIQSAFPSGLYSNKTTTSSGTNQSTTNPYNNSTAQLLGYLTSGVGLLGATGAFGSGTGANASSGWLSNLGSGIGSGVSNIYNSLFGSGFANGSTFDTAGSAIGAGSQLSSFFADGGMVGYARGGMTGYADGGDTSSDGDADPMALVDAASKTRGRQALDAEIAWHDRMMQAPSAIGDWLSQPIPSDTRYPTPRSTNAAASGIAAGQGAVDPSGDDPAASTGYNGGTPSWLHLPSSAAQAAPAAAADPWQGGIGDAQAPAAPKAPPAPAAAPAQAVDPWTGAAVPQAPAAVPPAAQPDQPKGQWVTPVDGGMPVFIPDTPAAPAPQNGDMGMTPADVAPPAPPQGPNGDLGMSQGDVQTDPNAPVPRPKPPVPQQVPQVTVPAPVAQAGIAAIKQAAAATTPARQGIGMMPTMIQGQPQQQPQQPRGIAGHPSPAAAPARGGFNADGLWQPLIATGAALMNNHSKTFGGALGSGIQAGQATYQQQQQIQAAAALKQAQMAQTWAIQQANMEERHQNNQNAHEDRQARVATTAADNMRNNETRQMLGETMAGLRAQGLANTQQYRDLDLQLRTLAVQNTQAAQAAASQDRQDKMASAEIQRHDTIAAQLQKNAQESADKTGLPVDTYTRDIQIIKSAPKSAYAEAIRSGFSNPIPPPLVNGKLDSTRAIPGQQYGVNGKAVIWDGRQWQPVSGNTGDQQ